MGVPAKDGDRGAAGEEMILAGDCALGEVIVAIRYVKMALKVT